MDIPRDMQDLLNRQTHVRLPDGREQENLYDGEGLRAGLTENGKSTTFLFYNGEILAECNGDSMPVRRHLSGAGLSHVQNMENNTFHAYHQDEQGSTAYVTGSTGGTENLYSYDGFGNILESREDIANRILYTGQQYDQETGQYYLRARYYNPVIGRFTQEDTYRGDGLNLYAYCANNPVMYYDPSGHDMTNSNGTVGCGGSDGKKQETTAVGEISEMDPSNPFYKEGGGSDLDDFMTQHSEKHAYDPNTTSTRNKTQFGENVDVAKLREDTMLHPDNIVYNSEHNTIKYEKEYDFNISTPDTPTGSHRVFINLDPKPGQQNRNSQFPYYGGKK